MYEDLVYRTCATDAQSQSSERVLAAGTSTTIKGCKRAAITNEKEPKAKRGEKPEKPDPVLTQPQIDKLTKQIDSINTALARDSEFVQSQSDFPDIPAPFVASYDLKKAELMSALAELTVSISGKTGKFSKLMGGAKACVNDYTAALERITGYVETLEQMGVKKKGSA